MNADAQSCWLCAHGYNFEIVNNKRIELPELMCGAPESAEYAAPACRHSEQACSQSGRWFEPKVKPVRNQWTARRMK